ncbi:hypothetical protein N7G274_010621 [Stereocaulon virgatum]|uniref:Uncharacterized protein n=1 Tax=Stereocaulon virgatum TaxID=373712 RepID=A0ABR3ZUX5_9LECA
MNVHLSKKKTGSVSQPSPTPSPPSRTTASPKPLRLRESNSSILSYGSDWLSLEERERSVVCHRAMSKDDRDMLDEAMELTAGGGETEA